MITRLEKPMLPFDAVESVRLQVQQIVVKFQA